MAKTRASHIATAAWPIGAVSQRTRVNIETIRYYERVGLLPRPRRTEGGYRLYDGSDVKRLAFIRRSRELGFGLDEIRALLKLADERPGTCAEVKALGERHLGDVEAKLADLRKMQRVLKELVSRCADGTVPDCPLIEALYDPPDADAPAISELKRRDRHGHGSRISAASRR